MERIHKKDNRGIDFVLFDGVVIGKRVDNTFYLDFIGRNDKQFLLDFIQFLRGLLKTYKAVKFRDEKLPDRFGFYLSNGNIILFTCDYLTYQFIYSHLNKNIVRKDLYMGNIIKEYLDRDTSEADINQRLAEVFDV